MLNIECYDRIACETDALSGYVHRPMSCPCWVGDLVTSDDKYPHFFKGLAPNIHLGTLPCY